MAALSLVQIYVRPLTGDFFSEKDGSQVGQSLVLWRVANLTASFGNGAIYATAAVTQILAMAGLATGLNKMVWEYGVFLGSLTFTLAYLSIDLVIGL